MTDCLKMFGVVAAVSTVLAASAVVAQERIVIDGFVVDAVTEKAPMPPVTVWYEEYGDEFASVSTSTKDNGWFKLDLPDGMGKLGLLSVREPGYNSAVLAWPVSPDTRIRLRLSKPVPIYGTITNSSGMAVSGAMLKWSMVHDGRGTSGMGFAERDGSFRVLVPAASDALRIAAWADLYAPTEVVFSYDRETIEPTVLQTLEDVRELPPNQRADEKYLNDWINDILSSGDPAIALPTR